MRKRVFPRGGSSSVGFRSYYEQFHSSELETRSICRNHLSSAVVHTNEREIPAIPPKLLVGSSPFCVSVLYHNHAQSRSVENEMPQAYVHKCTTRSQTN